MLDLFSVEMSRLQADLTVAFHYLKQSKKKKEKESDFLHRQTVIGQREWF